MRKRPVLKPGDVCRFSKKANKHSFVYKPSLVVLKILTMDGSEKFSKIQVAVSIPARSGFYKPYKIEVARYELWATGYNINGDKPAPVKKKHGLENLEPDLLLHLQRLNKTQTNSKGQLRGPHKCRCDDETFRRCGCVCNGL